MTAGGVPAATPNRSTSCTDPEATEQAIMTTTTREEAAKAEKLITELHGHTLNFERAQKAVKKRFTDIKDGNLRPNRTPTAAIIEQRGQARAKFSEFLAGLSTEQREILTIAYGPDWRREFEDLIDPEKDPQFA